MLTDQGRTALHDAAAVHVGDDRVPGMVVLVDHGGDTYTEAFGTLDIGGRLVQRDSLWRIASMTKPITGAATMVLVAEGLLDLDAPVDDVLPELAGMRVLRSIAGPLDDTVAAHRPITTRDLLTFTFGFGLATEIFTAAEPLPIVTAAAPLATLGPPDPDAQPEPDAWIRLLGDLPLMAQPGERWMYNTGANVLGVLLARAAGRPLGDVLRTRIFEPLGMKDTAFWTSETERLATCYTGSPEGLVLEDPPDGKWSRPPAFPDAAAGLVSTADDMLAFSRMLLGGGDPVLSSAAVQMMTSDQLTPAQKARGGLGPDFFADRSWGFCISVQSGGAFGWNGGKGTSWIADPASGLTVLVLTQRQFDSPEPPPVHPAVQGAAYAAVA